MQKAWKVLVQLRIEPGSPAYMAYALNIELAGMPVEMDAEKGIAKMLNWLYSKTETNKWCKVPNE